MLDPGVDAKTGKLRWYYQTTPHDVWDWDATEPPVLVDADWQGQPRKLLVQANRNSFFYVLDRTNGKAAACEALCEEVHLLARDLPGRTSDISCRRWSLAA